MSTTACAYAAASSSCTTASVATESGAPPPVFVRWNRTFCRAYSAPIVNAVGIDASRSGRVRSADRFVVDESVGTRRRDVDVELLDVVAAKVQRAAYGAAPAAAEPAECDVNQIG